MRPALYVRVSSEEQATKGNSLFEQEERGRAYCKAMAWEEPEVFIDDGYSAKDLNRPDITRLLEQVKERKFSIVVTTKLDRLSRKLMDILRLVEYFEKYNCAYASVSESFDTSTSAGKLTLQVLGAVAEFERERIRERVQENLRSLARQGKLIGKPAYGYDVVDGVYQVNIEESLIVKKIYEWTLDGKGPLSIAGILNQRGISTKNGTKWTENRIRKMLELETYIGQFIYNRTYRKGTKEVIRPENEWIVIEDHHMPIINRSVFEKVQSLLVGRKNGARKHHGDDRYLLSGLVICSHCGEKMNGRQNKHPGDREYYRYVCAGYQKKAICFYHFVHRDDLEASILGRIQEVAETAADKLQLIVSDAPKNSASEIVRLQDQLRGLDRRMQRQIEAYEKELITDNDLAQAKQRIEKERTIIQEAIRQTEKDDKKSAALQVQKRAKKALKDILSNDRLKCKQAISELIQRIEISNGTDIRIIWRR